MKHDLAGWCICSHKRGITIQFPYGWTVGEVIAWLKKKKLWAKGEWFA